MRKNTAKYSSELSGDVMTVTIITRYKESVSLLFDRETYDRMMSEDVRLTIKHYEKSPTVRRIICYKGNKYYSLSRWILGINDPNIKVLFKNQDELDFRIENLIPADAGNSAQNRRGAQKNSKSGIRGVWWDVRRGQWCAEFKYKGKKYYVGHFSDLDAAREEVVKKRHEVMGYSFSDQVIPLHV